MRKLCTNMEGKWRTLRWYEKRAEDRGILREQILRWFGHFERMGDERDPMKTKNSAINNSKKRYTEKELKIRSKKRHPGQRVNMN